MWANADDAYRLLNFASLLLYIEFVSARAFFPGPRKTDYFRGSLFIRCICAFAGGESVYIVVICC